MKRAGRRSSAGPALPQTAGRHPIAKVPYLTEDGVPFVTEDGARYYVTEPTIQPGNTKHGPRKNWREDEWAQYALQEVAYTLYGGYPPPGVKRRFLIDKVNEWLLSNPDWMATGYGNTGDIDKRDKGKISDRAVLRAWKKTFP
jgi:hypothetical protein